MSHQLPILRSYHRSVAVRRLAAGWVVVLAVLAAASTARATDLRLLAGRPAGTANGQALVMPDCQSSSLKIAPCQRVARSWLDHLNARADAFVDAYRAAGYHGPVTSVVLDCSSGILNNRRTRKGQRTSRHGYGEACDGNQVRVNDVTFRYRRAVTDKGSADRRFFQSLLDAWGEVGPGCVPSRGYIMMGMNVGCKPVLLDNCGVIDWRERGSNSQYGHTYHLSFCYYTDPQRAYE